MILPTSTGIIDPNTGQQIYPPGSPNFRGARGGGIRCDTAPSITWGEAEVKCYGEYKHSSGRPEYDVDDAAFIWQKAQIHIPSLPGQGMPPPYDYLENITEGVYFIVPVYRRDITNPVGEWQHVGYAGAYVLDDDGTPISINIPTDTDVNIAFGPYFPATLGVRWNGIPCRRPYEELLFGVCFETFMWGYALDEDGETEVTFRGAPCWNYNQWFHIPSSAPPEPFNVVEKLSSRSRNDNVDYGEPHTWADINYDNIDERKPSYAPLESPPGWEDNYHPVNSNAVYPYPHESNCGSACEDLGCTDHAMQFFNGQYRFGPYKSLNQYENPYNLGCPSSNPQCCTMETGGGPRGGAPRRSIPRPSRRASQANMTKWKNY